MSRSVRYSRPRTAPAESLVCFLASKFTYLSPTEWLEHIASGHLSVNDITACDGDREMQQGDIVQFSPPRALEPKVDEEHIQILLEDDDVVVSVKNGNLPVSEGGRYAQNTLTALLQRRGTDCYKGQKCSSRSEATSRPTGKQAKSGEHVQEEGGSVGRKRSRCPPVEASSVSPSPHTSCSVLLTVHRLDKETSGLVVLAKNSASAAHLGAQFEEKTSALTVAVQSLVDADGPDALATDEAFDALLHTPCGAGAAVSKGYIALVSGALPIGTTFVVTTRMGKLCDDPTRGSAPEHTQLRKLKMVCYPLESTTQEGSEHVAGSGTASKSRIACTRLRVLRSSALLNASLVRVDLLTGRSHQIRLHCAHLGHPILGDKLYLTTSPGRRGCSDVVPDATYLERVRNEEDPYLLVSRLQCRRHALHAADLSFQHPGTGAMIRFQAPCAEWFLLDVRGADSQAQRELENLVRDT